jgi:uncharacterized protein involved in type VI secretion and phage assembly
MMNSTDAMTPPEDPNYQYDYTPHDLPAGRHQENARDQQAVQAWLDQVAEPPWRYEEVSDTWTPASDSMRKVTASAREFACSGFVRRLQPSSYAA